jgi:hypothetical protein
MKLHTLLKGNSIGPQFPRHTIREQQSFNENKIKSFFFIYTNELICRAKYIVYYFHLESYGYVTVEQI